MFVGIHFGSPLSPPPHSHKEPDMCWWLSSRCLFGDWSPAGAEQDSPSVSRQEGSQEAQWYSWARAWATTRTTFCQAAWQAGVNSLPKWAARTMMRMSPRSCREGEEAISWCCPLLPPHRGTRVTGEFTAKPGDLSQPRAGHQAPGTACALPCPGTPRCAGSSPSTFLCLCAVSSLSFYSVPSFLFCPCPPWLSLGSEPSCQSGCAYFPFCFNHSLTAKLSSSP